MPGIYGFLSTKGKEVGLNLFKNFHSYDIPNTINEERKYNNFLFGRSVIPKFLEDRIIFEDQEIIIAIEGTSTNIERGRLVNFLKKEFKSDDNAFANKIEGSFSGFIYDKLSSCLFLFTDQLSTKPLYYYLNEDNGVFFFASELKVISKALRESGHRISIDNDGVRCLLTFGFMLSDITPIAEIKKIEPGSIFKLDIKSFKFFKKQYFQLEKSKANNASKNELIEEVDRLLISAVDREWNKDKEYGYDHFAFLSGGLDSRVNVILADKLGYKPSNLLTFSEEGTLDEMISRKIAKDLGHKHTFISLNDGKYLEENLSKYISQNDGLVVLYGAAHMSDSVGKIDLKTYGYSHSGQIGDALFGSLYKVSSPDDNLDKLCYGSNLKIVDKIEVWNEMKVNDYGGDDFEIFSYKHRVVNGVLNGDRSISSMIDSISPFYDRELFNFCINLPVELKNNSWFYKDWMEQKHLEIQSYKWQASGTYPRNGFYTDLISFGNRVIRFGRRKIGIEKENMNPFQSWYNRNEKLSNSLKRIYEENIHLVDDQELKLDITNEFNSSSATDKLNAISAILSIKLHFFM